MDISHILNTAPPPDNSHTMEHNYFDVINNNGIDLMQKCCDWLGVSYVSLNVWMWVIYESLMIMLLFAAIFISQKRWIKPVIVSGVLASSFLTMMLFHIIWSYL